MNGPLRDRHARFARPDKGPAARRAYGFPVGHIDSQWTVPLGVRARMDATNGDVELLEAAVT